MDVSHSKVQLSVSTGSQVGKDLIPRPVSGACNYPIRVVTVRPLAFRLYYKPVRLGTAF